MLRLRLNKTHTQIKNPSCYLQARNDELDWECEVLRSILIGVFSTRGATDKNLRIEMRQSSRLNAPIIMDVFGCAKNAVLIARIGNRLESPAYRIYTSDVRFTNYRT
jgi:hypothetical protein